MLPQYRTMQNAHGLRALLRAPIMPNPALAIAGDDEMSDIPLLIFRDQHLPMPTPIIESIQNLPYEKTAIKGANDRITIDDLTMDAFDIGAPYDSI